MRLGQRERLRTDLLILTDFLFLQAITTAACGWAGLTTGTMESGRGSLQVSEVDEASVLQVREVGVGGRVNQGEVSNTEFIKRQMNVLMKLLYSTRGTL